MLYGILTGAGYHIMQSASLSAALTRAEHFFSQGGTVELFSLDFPARDDSPAIFWRFDGSGWYVADF